MAAVPGQAPVTDLCFHRREAGLGNHHRLGPCPAALRRPQAGDRVQYHDIAGAGAHWDGRTDIAAGLAFDLAGSDTPLVANAGVCWPRGGGGR